MSDETIVLEGSDLEAARRVVESRLICMVENVTDGGTMTDLDDLLAIRDVAQVMRRLGRVGAPVYGPDDFGSNGVLSPGSAEILAAAAVYEKDAGADMAENNWHPGEYPDAVLYQRSRSMDGIRVLTTLRELSGAI